MSRWRRWKRSVKKRRNKRSFSTQEKALGQNICMSPHKARRVIDQIRGRSYEETLMLLELMPYRASYPIFKLVYSAAANASHNKNFNKADLVISKAEVNGGTVVKRLKPRARGRSYPIKRPTCHINIALKDKTKLKTEQDLVLENRYVFRDVIIERYMEKERQKEINRQKRKKFLKSLLRFLNWNREK